MDRHPAVDGVNVPFLMCYLDTRFTFSIDKAGQTVLVLSQPDNRYFGGMRGLYRLQLHFRLYKDGQDTYLLRSMEDTGSTRACSAELDPEAVSYSILVKITAYRVDNFATARVQLFPSVQLLLLLSDAYGERLEVPARDEVQRSWFASTASRGTRGCCR